MLAQEWIRAGYDTDTQEIDAGLVQISVGTWSVNHPDLFAGQQTSYRCKQICRAAHESSMAHVLQANGYLDPTNPCPRHLVVQVAVGDSGRLACDSSGRITD